MNEALWEFVDAIGVWVAQAFGMPKMTGRVYAWLMVCDPPEQTAAELAAALQASKGSISSATGMLVRQRLVDRIHIRGERSDRFRLRPGSVDEQMDSGASQALELLNRGLEAMRDEPPARRARLEEITAFYAWWESRVPELIQEWHEYKRTKVGGTHHG